MNFFGTTFRKTLLFIILLELFSFAGYLVPVFNQIAFAVLILLFLIICLERLDWGVYILLAELFIGSKGYLFYYNFDGTLISIRIAFWLVIMGVWFYRSGITRIFTRNNAEILQTKFFFFKSKLFYWFAGLFAVIAWGLAMGFMRGNSFNNIFDDFNAYLFFGLIFVFYDAITSWDQIKQVMQVLVASLAAMSLKTIGLLYLFSHQFFGISYLYKWVRTSGVGEITNMGGNYYRIFFQSHIFVIIGFVVFLVFLLFNKYQLEFRKFLRGIMRKATRNNAEASTENWVWRFTPILILLSSVILISLSRSFWVGLISGLIILFVYYLTSADFNYKKFIANFLIICLIVFYLLFLQWTKFYLALVLAMPLVFYILIKIIKLPRNQILTFSSVLVIIFLLGFALANDVVKFPWPTGGVSVNLAELIGERATTVSGEAAVGSRWNLLKPLSIKIIQFPTILIGSGFGSTVTYTSSDPRILAKDPTGQYTTYAFEWGYLDIWLKLGLIGLGVYLLLLWKIFLLGWDQIKNANWQMADDKSRLILGLLLGLLIIIVIHGFTPYLNHPLGIGYLLLCVVIFDVLEKKPLIRGI
jgi:hypothetical protein